MTTICSGNRNSKHLKDCVAENFSYMWRWNPRKNMVQIKSKDGSCQRGLAECDRRFALDLWTNQA